MISTWFCVTVILTQAQVNSNELDQALAAIDRLNATAFAVDYQNETVQHVLDDLNGRLSIPVRADWPLLSRLGVHPDDHITLRLNPTISSTVLSAIALTLGDEFERPTFEIQAGQLIFTTLAGCAPMRLTSVYDVRDLLSNEELVQKLRDEPSPEPLPTEKKPKTTDSHDAPAAPPAPPPVDPAPPINPRDRRQPITIPKLDVSDLKDERPSTPGERLYLMITDHVDPEAWMNFGGNRALVSDRDGVLMITATPTTHYRFRNALASLRRANPRSITVDAAIVDLPRSNYETIVRQNSPNSTSLAIAVQTDASASMLWRTANAVAMDSRLDVESTANGASLHTVLLPHLEKTSHVLTIEIQASAKQGDDVRSIKTAATLVGDDSSAVIELPAAKPSGNVRLMVLTVQRQ